MITTAKKAPNSCYSAISHDFLDNNQNHLTSSISSYDIVRPKTVKLLVIHFFSVCQSHDDTQELVLDFVILVLMTAAMHLGGWANHFFP